LPAFEPIETTGHFLLSPFHFQLNLVDRLCGSEYQIAVLDWEQKPIFANQNG
jgi:hypothetical protein